MQLEGKVIAITGAASGIGRAAAIAAAQDGARLVLSDIALDGVEETARIIGDLGVEAVAMRVDVTRASEVEAFMQLAIDRFDRLDGTVNNAGIGGEIRPTHEVSESLWEKVIEVNLKGVWLCMKYAIPRFTTTHGSIVNIASVAGLIGFRNNAVYAASKHAVVGLTKSAALEYAREGLRVNAVCPGFTDTPMVGLIEEARPGMMEATVRAIPMRRLGEPHEIAAGILWLLSDASSFVTGHTLTIDGGTTVI
ncbi:MAG: SDR family oxidoreductase [Anaerolineae bacterium]|jgi:NAD(P)-dependent dehydrogenase (short-subunit alcohol dehydrogenase family)|nr:SDR family oxidoreductase [Anaerolineae bacterium]